LPSHDFNESSIALSALAIDSSSTKSSNKNALKQQHQQRKSEPETNTKAISVSSNFTTNNLLTTSTSNHVHSTNTNGHQQNFGNSAQNTKAAFPFTSPTLPVKTKSKAGFSFNINSHFAILTGQDPFLQVRIAKYERRSALFFLRPRILRFKLHHF
jgi:hypothetical protein